MSAACPDCNDAKDAASGVLYLDDGHSTDNSRGAFLLRKFVYDGGVLTASSAGGAGYRLGNTVERIQVMGEKRHVQAVKVLEPEARVVRFSQVFTGAHSLITVALPNVPIGDDWKIQFDFVVSA